ncbi:cytochrome c-type biogenesis protein CcmH [Moritella sp. Urea-trap-13]|uniref:cytochrome c-type biogenesis protein CcmH n=1 Tax=Moritella sp. Urea-trap-13 TaxID=2058327 RepID=UPI000C3430A6|nr:cytochrome c-type biogenesis protein CcmH [Moritella sp. Urea-trap-13]PKH06088.1 heme lyase NrfEFG subunit NrfF [Moritella sp. Urea-trap-13]
MKRLSAYMLMLAMFTTLPLSAQPLASNTRDSGVEATQSVEVFAFNSIDTQNRAMHLARQLRCPQCKNQNLMESNSPIAKDLRLAVYMMVNKGETDAQVIDFMTSRFGDMVLYKPKFEPRTYILWLGPVFFIGLFAWLGYRKVKASIVV